MLRNGLTGVQRRVALFFPSYVYFTFSEYVGGQIYCIIYTNQSDHISLMLIITSRYQSLTFVQGTGYREEFVTAMESSVVYKGKVV